MTSLWLDAIPEVLRSMAVERFDAGDVEGFLGLAEDNEYQLGLVSRNMAALREHGLYEKGLVSAFIMFPTLRAPMPTLRWLFEKADRTRLREANPLPGPGPFTLYRGVSGPRRVRRVRGLSWTGSLEIARWFADRRALADPAVYRVIVTAGRVLAYTNDRAEDEYVVALDPSDRPARL